MNVEVVWDWNKNVVQVDSKYTLCKRGWMARRVR